MKKTYEEPEIKIIDIKDVILDDIPGVSGGGGNL